jgi:hypothetical protein
MNNQYEDPDVTYDEIDEDTKGLDISTVVLNIVIPGIVLIIECIFIYRLFH